MKSLALAFLLASCAHWTKPEIAAEALALVVTAADWHQTIGITAACQEANPVIGPCGERLSPRVWFPLTMVGHALVAAVLPRPWRIAWSASLLGAEANQVWSNYEVGDPVLPTEEISRVLLTGTGPRSIP